MSIGDLPSAHYEEEEPLQNPFTQKENKPQNLVEGAVASVKKGQQKRPKHTLPPRGEKPVGAYVWEKAAEQIKKGQEDPVQKIPEVPYLDARQVESMLKEGDIFLSYYPSGSRDAIAAGITQGQKAAKNLPGSKFTPKSHNFVHAAMYVGDGVLTEAVGDGIRINRLDGERFKLETGMKHSFVVVEPKNPELAKWAAKFAEELATDKDQPAIHQYSILKALGSALTADNSLTKDSVKRYLKGWAYAETGITPVDRNGIREFFCSHFIGWACQAGESKEVIKKINNSLGEISKIVPPKCSPTSTPEEYGKILDDWAQKNVNQHYDLIQSQIRIRIDPKFTSPQHLYLFFLANPDAFTFKMRIVAPEKEMEMKSKG